MAIFGLSTQKEVKAIVEEAVKAAMIANGPSWIYPTAESEQYSLGDPSAYAEPQTLYRKLSWIAQCVNNVANSAALAKFSVARVVSGKEPKDIPNHPFEMLLKKPNPLDGRYLFLFATVASKKLTGNAYWFNNAESEFAKPDELWFIPSHMIIPVPDSRMYLRGFMYYPGNGMEIMLEPWQVVHFRSFNPFSRFVGLSAIESLMLTSVGDLAMQKWTTQFFGENNARLPSILTFEQMIAQPTWDKIKDDTREATKKREMLMLRGVGAGGVNWMQNSVAQKDMEYLQQRAFNKEEIYNTLAPGLLSYLSVSSTEANSRTGKAAFDELSVYPEHVMMNEQISSEILPKYGSDNSRPLVGYFEDVRMEDRDLKLREQEAFAKSHTIEEIREEFYGDDPLGDDRDKLLPSQVNAQSGGIQKPPPSPFTDRTPEEEKPIDVTDELRRTLNKPPKEEEKEADPVKAVLSLGTWRRMAIKSVGKVVSYTPIDIPSPIAEYVNQHLPHCTSAKAVRDVFDNAIRMAKQKDGKQSEAALILEGIRLALEKA